MATTETNEEILKQAKEAQEEAHEAMNEAKEAMAEADEAMAEVKELKQEVSEEKKQLEDFKNKFYYLAAEMENLKKRHERDLQHQIKFGNEKVLKGLVEVVDNLERTVLAIANDEDTKIKNLYTGIEMVKNQFLEVLKTNGLETVEALGKEFDPNFHEALAQMPAEGKKENEVIQVYQQGYILNGRLLRAAKVVVAKN